VVALSLPVLVACAGEPDAGRDVLRLDELLGQAEVHVQPQQPREPLVAYEFESPDARGWSVGNASSSVSLVDGVLRFETRGPDRIMGPEIANLRTGQAEIIALRLRAKGTGSIDVLWRTQDENGLTSPTRVRFGPDAQRAVVPPASLGRAYVPIFEQDRWLKSDVETSGFGGWRRAIGPVHERPPDRRILRLGLATSTASVIEVDFLRVLRAGDYLASRGPVAVAQHEIDRSLRTCLSMSGPGEISYRLTVPDNARFSCGLGVVEAGPSVAFRVEVETGGVVETVLERTVSANTSWQDEKVDLSELAGKRVTLRLEVATADDDGNVALWANPTLYRMLEDDTPSLRSASVNVVLYLIDALRADQLSTYGSERDPAQLIASLADRGVTFDRYFTSETWTKPSVATMETGVPSLVHGVTGLVGGVPNVLSTVQETLRSHGIETAVVTENSHIGKLTNLARGFSRYEMAHIPDLEETFLPSDTFERAEEFLETHRDRPFFLYVHTIEPHAPYAPPPRYLESFLAPGEKPRDIDLYDGEIARADVNLGRLCDVLRRLDLDRRTVLVILADHGEAFREHEGMVRHGGKPYIELLHVPLVFHAPGLLPEGRRVAQLVQTIDIAPTLLEIFGIDPASQYRGRSLVPLLLGEPVEDGWNRTLFAIGRGAAAAITDRYALISNVAGPDRGVRHLYDLSSDMKETVDLAGNKPEIADELQGYILETAAAQRKMGEEIRRLQAERAGAESPLPINPKEVERLRAMGYVE
jgi:arylsulfatase A-like enzyme